MKPVWLSAFDGLRAGRARGYALCGNTSDKVFWKAGDIPPMPLKYFLARYLIAEGYAVATYSLANGFEELRPRGSGQSASSSPSPFAALPNNLTADQVLAHCTGWLRSDKIPVALILDYADHLAPTSTGMNAVVGQLHLAMIEILHAWALDENIRATRNLVLLISPEGQLNDLLLQGAAAYKRLDISLPDDETRCAFIERLRARESSAGSALAGVPVEQMTRLTSGLPLIEIEEMFSVAATSHATSTAELVRERKARVMRQLCGDLLEVHEPAVGFEGVSGLPHAKEELSRVIRAFRRNPKSAPQALCFVGVPGCGKSFLVTALAKELEVPCLAMRNVRGGIVGSTERNLERVLWIVENLAPCVVWIDELDQQFGQRNTGQTMDAGVSERFIARIWEFMGSVKHRGRILWVATSNRPDLLDQALLDRFQLTMPFLHPTPGEVEALLPTLAGQVGRQLAPDVRAVAVAQLSSLQTPTVRGLQEVVARAAALADDDATDESNTAIDHAHLVEAAQDFKPNFNPLQHQLIALNALRMTRFSSLLPWRDRRGRRAGVEVPAYARELVDPVTGALDNEALTRRIAELTIALQADLRDRRF